MNPAWAVRMSNMMQIHEPVIPNRCSNRSNLGFIRGALFCNAFSHSSRKQEPSGITATAHYLGSHGSACTWVAQTLASSPTPLIILAPRLVLWLAGPLIVWLPSFCFLCGDSIVSLRVARSLATAIYQPRWCDVRTGRVCQVITHNTSVTWDVHTFCVERKWRSSILRTSRQS